MAEKKNTKNSKKKRTGLGFAIWLILVIVIVIIFIVKWPDIKNNLIRTGFMQGTITEKPEKESEPAEEQEKKNESIITLKPEKKPEVQIIVEPDKPVSNPSVSEPVTVGDPKKEETKPAETKTETQTEVSKPKPVETPKVEEPAPIPQTSVKVCFVVIDADGTINYKTVSRSVAKSDSPLTTAINVLLEGPADAKFRTLIPRGTKLLSATVKDKVAFLNFNDNFEFNEEGVEGYIAQLKQIIITATEFKTVESVQFLINGQKKEYIGSDGVYIGAPLSRTSY